MLTRSVSLRYACVIAGLCAALAMVVTAAHAQSTLRPASQPQGGDGDAVKVTAKGIATFRADDAGRSQEEAMEAARRDAVEQVSGVFIGSESEMKNFDLVKDEVVSRSQGYVRNAKIVNRNVANGILELTIEAEVVKSAFIKSMQDSLEDLYRRVGRPRVMMLIKEFKGDATEPAPEEQSVAAREIRTVLLKQGFTFVDPRVVTRAAMATAEKGKEGNPSAFVQLGQVTKAEIIMMGEVHTSAKPVMGQFNRVQADMSMDVVRTDNGTVMAAQTSSALGLHIDENSARITALQKVAQDITPKLAEQISYQWIKEKNEGTSLELVVKGANFGDLSTLRKTLSNDVRGVKQVTQRSFSQGTAVLVLTTRDSSDRVAQALAETKFPNFTLDIVDQTQTSVIVDLKRTP